jgi:peptide/nickel transport system permease protein
MNFFVKILWRASWRIALRLVTRLPLIALLACTLLCLAPGFDADERRLDLRLSSQSIAALAKAQQGTRNPLAMSAGYLAAVVHGDLGESTTFGAPVQELVSDRWPATLRSLVGGLCGGWLLAAGTATLVALLRSQAMSSAAGTMATALISVPSALLGLIAMLLNGPVAGAMAVVIFARVYQYAGRILERTAGAPHVVCAVGAGLSRWRLFRFASVAPALPELIAVGAASVGMALASVVPLEVVCDSPGLGQLAWKAALGRDAPLLLFVTLAMAAAANLSNTAADTAIEALARRRT